jgi:hypothetical protein
MSESTGNGIPIELGKIYEVVEPGGTPAMTLVFKPVRFHESGVIGGIIYDFLSGTFNFSKWYPHDYMEKMTTAEREQLPDHFEALEIRPGNLGSPLANDIISNWQEHSKNRADWFFTAPPDQTLIDFEQALKS